MTQQARAVQFGKSVDQGRGAYNRTLPGLFPFFNSEQDTFDQTKAVDPMLNFTITIPALGEYVHYVKTPADHIYKIKRLIFTAYLLSVAGEYENLETFGGYYYDIGGDSQLAYARPYTRYILMRFSVVSGGDRTLISGNLLDQTSGAIWAGQNAFIRLPTMQSEDYGGQSVFTPYLLPAEATVRYHFCNQFTSNLLLTCIMIGTRARL